MFPMQKFYTREQICYSTHCIHPYPSKLIPQIARFLIQRYAQEGDTILDPFCGSGTGLLEAALLKRNSIGLDINPLACLISRVKTTPLPSNTSKNTLSKLLESLPSSLPQKNLSNYTEFKIPNFPKREVWFQPDVLNALAILKSRIAEIDDQKIRDICNVAFSFTVKKASNGKATYQLSKLKKPRKLTTFEVFEIFENKMQKMSNSIAQLNNPINQPKVLLADAHHLNSYDSVDFILTNPPLFNYNIASYFKIYFPWLDFGDIKYVHKRCIGKTGKYRKVSPVSRYFNDMQLVFSQMHSSLKENGHLCVLTSDFTLHGRTIPCTSKFLQLAERAGFKHQKTLTRTIPKKLYIFAKQDKIENYLVFRK